MDIKTIILLSIIAAIFVVMVVSSLVTILRLLKKASSAATVADEEEAKSAILSEAMKLVGNTEKLYSSVNTLLKGQCQTAGSLKKDSVMSKLKSFAIDNGYAYDEEYADSVVESIVELMNTNKVK